MIRSLSNSLQKKAEEELNENPNRIQEDLEHIRNWLSKQPHLNIKTDDQWLLTFLRGSKFSLQRTKEKIDFYYTLRTLTPEFFADRDPFSSITNEILNSKVLLVLPNTVDPAGPRIIIMRWRASSNCENITFIKLMKVFFMSLDILMNEDDNSVIGGIHVLFDYKGFPLEILQQTTPSMAKKCVLAVQNAYPIRFKGFHNINMTPLFDVFVNMFKWALNDKLRKRVLVYTESKVGDLYKDVPQYLLPNEYGGNAGSVEDLAASWKEKVESYRDWLLEDAKYRSEETLRVGEPKTSANVFGVEGSFRKLAVD